MNERLKLFFLLIGCKPLGRNTEQHDVFFTIANSLSETVPAILNFWPEAKGVLHLDGWREIRFVDGYEIAISEKNNNQDNPNKVSLFFINLGGYKKEEFEEFHYKILLVASDKAEAIQRAKDTAFFKHTGFKGAASHIDDKFGVDVDDVLDIEEILPEEIKKKYRLIFSPDQEKRTDEIHPGYFKLSKL